MLVNEDNDYNESMMDKALHLILKVSVVVSYILKVMRGNLQKSS